MSVSYWNLASGNFFQDWSDTGLITTNDNWDNVPSIVGYRGDGLTTATGTDPRTIFGTSSVVNVIANQTNVALTTGGIAEFQIANPVVAMQGSGAASAPYLELFLNASGREGITLSFNIRDIDSTTDNAIQQVNVQYRLGDGGAWTNVQGGYVADATTGPSQATLVTPVSVTLPDVANGSATLQVRIMTTNAVGNDEWVGIDDISVTSRAATVLRPGTLSIADASTTEGNSGSHNIDFLVTRVNGTDGAVDATYTVTLPGGYGGADAADFGPFARTGTVHFDAGQSSAHIYLPVLGDTSPEPNETFTIALSGATGGAAIDRAVATGTILNDDVLPLVIGQIQGEGHISPYVNQTVRTTGIVTGVDANGFYLQDYGDGNSRTSDGIFVFTSSAPTVFVGDAATVQGKVAEFQSGTGGLTVTEITGPTVTVTSTGNVLPAAVVIGTGAGMLAPPTQVIDDDHLTSYDPTTDGIDFWESLEGMRVTLDRPQVVSNTTDDSFQETDVVVSQGVGATGLNARGGITISPGDYNPEKIQIDGHDALYAGFKPSYTIGDQLSSVTGIVNYAAANYEVLVTAPVSVTKDVTLTQETTALHGDLNHLSLASYNVENLDTSDNKFDVLAANIVNNLQTPDIIALQEIQDADGAGSGSDLSGQKTAQGLIDAIHKISGKNYVYVEIAPSAPNTTGGEPNGNIRSGYLYNIDRVHYVQGSAELIDGAAYQGTRRPLVASWTFNGQTLTTVDVHLTSRGGSDPLWGATQPPVDAGDAARTAQAAGVKAWVAAHSATNPNVAILGDWNGFYFEEAQTQLTDPAKGGTFTNLNTLLPSQERYSYEFGGNAQQIDNLLVTGGLLGGASYDIVHLNSEFGAARPTDHDPQIALLQLGSVPANPPGLVLLPDGFVNDMTQADGATAQAIDGSGLGFMADMVSLGAGSLGVAYGAGAPAAAPALAIMDPVATWSDLVAAKAEAPLDAPVAFASDAGGYEALAPWMAEHHGLTELSHAF